MNNKKSKLTKAALTLSCLSALFPIGMIAQYFISGNLIPIIIVIGFIMTIPAVIVSVISLLASLATRVDFAKRAVALCVSLVLPALVLGTIFIFKNPINYSQAMKSFESKDYVRANELFSDLKDYKDSEEMANESLYLHAVALAGKKEWKDARAALETIADADYKASKKLYAYCDVYVQAEIQMQLAENKLKSNLKDPSSYVAYNREWSYSIRDNESGSSLIVDFTFNFTYTAKNSFGGTVKESRSYDDTVYLSNKYGFTANELKDILEIGINKIANSYDK